MKMNFENVLLLYKKSAYSIYFLERKAVLIRKKTPDIKNEIKRFKKAHDEHHRTLKIVESMLRRYGIRCSKRSRGQRIDFSKYDLVITVGGDGTFLEAARSLKDQVIIGVNSAPSFSVGKLCAADAKNFPDIMNGLLHDRLRFTFWPRLHLNLQGHACPVECTNDILVCHSNPAAMSRYYLEMRGIKEEQRSSGLWIAAPAGTSGAIKSAGGRVLKPDEKKIQYMPRELYGGFKQKYRLQGGILNAGSTITITSLMREGAIFVDGTHFNLKFPFNAVGKVSLSPHPLRTVKI